MIVFVEKKSVCVKNNKYLLKKRKKLFNHIWCGCNVGVLIWSISKKAESFNRLIPMLTGRWAKYPLPFKLGIGVLGYLLFDIGVENALRSLCRQALLRLASSAPQNFSAKCSSCSFNSSKPKLMFEYTSPRKLGSVYSNMNSGVDEAESVKFSPFSGELHLNSFSLLIYSSSLSATFLHSSLSTPGPSSRRATAWPCSCRCWGWPWAWSSCSSSPSTSTISRWPSGGPRTPTRPMARASLPN